jgi:molybdenum cofactor guanylyltransferase
MGADKATLAVEGVPMAARVARALHDAGAGEVACVGGDLEALRGLGLDAVADAYPDEGPLAGVITALAWAQQPIVVVAPCDLVSPSADVLRALVEGLRGSDADAAVPLVDGHWRPLPVALRATARGPLLDAFAQRERAVHRAMARLELVAVDAGPVADADSPEDLPGHR